LPSGRTWSARWGRSSGLPDLHAAEQDIIAEQQATQAVFTGFLDRSVLYGVLAHMEMLGLDLVEVQRVMKDRTPSGPA
jgi:hypothetical protein